MRAAAWSKRVDLPMPGSPPIRVAEPATSPPPTARSNSAMPLLIRSGSTTSASRPTSSNGRPPERRLCRAANGVTTAPLSSTSVFHSEHSAHWPCQRLETDPQAWQTYRLRGFAIIGRLARGAAGRKGPVRPLFLEQSALPRIHLQPASESECVHTDPYRQ